jgi:hypothetical protein
MNPFFDPRPEEGGITAMDMLVVEEVLGMADGYVLNFNDRTFNAFVARHLQIDVTAPMYTGRGTSKANRLRALIYAFVPEAQAEVLQVFGNHRRTLEQEGRLEPLDPKLDEQYRAIVTRLARDAADAPNLEIERFSADATLNSLVEAIERDIAADAPHTALDRLHTYCMKKFAALCLAAGLEVGERDTLQGRVGRYINALRKSGTLDEISNKIAKSTVQIFEQFNDVRNHNSLAHDNQLLKRAEGQYVLESVLSLLRFVRALDGQAFGR